MLTGTARPIALIRGGESQSRYFRVGRLHARILRTHGRHRFCMHGDVGDFVISKTSEQIFSDKNPLNVLHRRRQDPRRCWEGQQKRKGVPALGRCRCRAGLILLPLALLPFSTLQALLSRRTLLIRLELTGCAVARVSDLTSVYIGEWTQASPGIHLSTSARSISPLSYPLHRIQDRPLHR